MKITTLFLIALMSIQLNGCKSKKETTKSTATAEQTVTKPTIKNEIKKTPVATTPVKVAPKTKENPIQKGFTITYATSSRGMQESVIVKDNTVTIKSSSRVKGNKSDTKKISDKGMKELRTILERINYKSFSKIEAPSKKHQYDAAPAATVTVFNGKQSITCPTFDAGNPPKELEALIAKLLSFK